MSTHLISKPTSVCLDPSTRALMDHARSLVTEHTHKNPSQSRFIRDAVRALALGIIQAAGEARETEAPEAEERLRLLMEALASDLPLAMTRVGGERA